MVIVATSFGETLSSDLLSSGVRTHLVKAPRTPQQHVTKPLVVVNGVPVINYWLTQLRKSPRLLPVEQSVYIICNEANREEVRLPEPPCRAGRS